MSLSDIINKPLVSQKPYDIYINSIHMNQPSASASNDQILTYNTTSGLVTSKPSAEAIGNGYTSMTVADAGQVVPPSENPVTHLIYRNTFSFDTLGLSFSNVSGLFTVLIAGYFFITANTIITTNGNGYNQFWINFPVENYRLSDITNSPVSGSNLIMTNCNIGVSLSVGDTFGVSAYQTSGANQTVQGANGDGLNISGINIIRLSPANIN